MPSLANFNLGNFRLKGWQLLLLLLIVVCGVVFSLGLTSMSVVWDETPHLVGGLMLYQGKIGQYFEFSRYPPLLDMVIAGYFKIFGVNVFAARLVSVTFSLLTIAAVFFFAAKAYGKKVAFASSAILATMPGFIWLSRVALLEASLEFFFVLVLLLFLYWLHDGRNRTILLCGLVLGVAAFDKYQGIIAGLVLLAELPLLYYRGELKPKLSKFPLLILAAAVIIVPTIIWSIFTGTFDKWLGLLQSSDPQVNVYGTRFFAPLFYFYEMTVPTTYAHPIYLIVLAVGLVGLAFFVWRRKPEDKLLLAWFAVVYVCFTLIGTKSWRYVLPLFPVIAIAAANLIVSLYGKLEKMWKATQTKSFKKTLVKMSAGLLIIATAGLIVASSADAYNWIQTDVIYVPLPEAMHYVANGFDSSNQSVMIVCSGNLMNPKAANFYLSGTEGKTNPVVVYPSEPSDAFNLNFNVTEWANCCNGNNTKYLLLYENRDWFYFNSTMNAASVVELMINSGQSYYVATFGVQPNRIFVFQFNSTATQT